MNVSAWSIRNPIPAVLLFLLLTLAGLLAFKYMRIQQGSHDPATYLQTHLDLVLNGIAGTSS